MILTITLTRIFTLPPKQTLTLLPRRKLGLLQTQLRHRIILVSQALYLYIFYCPSLGWVFDENSNVSDEYPEIYAFAFALRDTTVNHIRGCVVTTLYPALPRFKSKMALYCGVCGVSFTGLFHYIYVMLLRSHAHLMVLFEWWLPC